MANKAKPDRLLLLIPINTRHTLHDRAASPRGAQRSEIIAINNECTM